MTTFKKTLPRLRCLVTTGVAAVALVISTQQAQAFSGFLTNFNNTYGGSATGANADCAVCHRSTNNTGGGLNEYGFQFQQNGQNFAAIEGLPSANINNGTSMLDEINASTQPGWTTGANNNIYDFDGNLLASNASPPGGIAGDLDPGAANLPPVADANGPYSGTAGSPVSFDGTGSSDPDGTIASYAWDFGDGGTGTGATPTYTYAAAGTYTVTLTVTDDGGLTDSATSTAAIGAGNAPPIADANGPYNGTAGQQVTFDGSGSSDPDGTIVAYDWDFGDGNTGTGVAPTNTYAAAGTYTVTLTVTDDGGLTNSATSTATIVAAPADPIADPNGPYNGFEGVALTLDGSGSFDPDGGTITQYDWDFGDGNTGVGVSPTHTYTLAGTYTVTLTVVDDEGAISTAATTTATIEPSVVDLDIAQFKVTKRVRLARVKPVGIQLTVKNNGTIEGDAPATVVGVQNGVEVYNETVTVTDAVGNGRTKFDFPAYIPTDAGDIVWTATIADGDPDDDTALATTTVVQ